MTRHLTRALCSEFILTACEKRIERSATNSGIVSTFHIKNVTCEYCERTPVFRKRLARHIASRLRGKEE